MKTRKVSLPILLPYCLMRFNGAASVKTRKVDQLCAKIEWDNASMGPRP